MEEALAGKGSSSSSYIPILILLASPVLYTIAIAPDTFQMGWNEGRGGFLFALVFIVAEIVGIRYGVSRRRLYAASAIAVACMVYFTLVENGYRQVIMDSASQYGARLKDSWTWMWDYVVLGTFMVASLSIIYGRRWLRIAPASPIYLLGSAIILSLDAFFPYNTLGPLQFVVPYLLQFDAWIINTLDIGSATARGNMLFLNGSKGSMALQVFWPSAGVHSMIIYSLVMLAFLLKMNIQPRRKAIYFAIGVAGTVFVNTMRILALSIYVLTVSADVNAFESFHSIAGEIMFLPWLAGYLILIMYVESRRARRSMGKDAAGISGGKQ
ncbi:MAG: thaumarchaeosortase [Candidatus Nitrosocaldus sp.]|nr:thaumarchaeosortase [Candidatus Nitrosocaldus sp.]MCS7141869.1 thaumarchaeosortase [Candidatus Nitrosocaldus sp.]MDW8000385.1 thaumarchaeosortase [Candidatus Nitrosocaldus sp.]MDW8275222.1 thaumarchaeosortase [Candidatus Nitrosocaldus sp.]